MLISRRMLLGASVALASTGIAQGADSDAPGVVSRFCDELLAVMKLGKRVAFNDRYARLAPAVTRTFDLPLMIRIAVGPSWAQFDATRQQALAAAFSQYTISEYTSRFDDFGGERFDVSPTPTTNANGLMVGTRLIKSNGDPVVLNYLMRQSAPGEWRAIDVYLDGTISELAARRSEFAAALRQGGAEALVQLLLQRAAALRTA
ncbi:MAG: ABC transporter substrate-binding protein [Alphaproteobacteria bacterium]|nr:ABC transporter substrate-binding protein [Alphaproteobacteria bacterium]